MSVVRILSKSKLQLLSIDDLPPPGSTIPLSFFDAGLVDMARRHVVLLYPNAPASSLLAFKSSLALTLPHFHPFAGDLTYLSSSRDVAIICSEDSGVDFIEAISDLDIRRLSDDTNLDVELFRLLMPKIDGIELPMPIMSVQFTAFSKGGVAIGMYSHHAAMDGWGLSEFMRCWSKTAREGVVSLELKPVHDREVISHASEAMKKQKLEVFAPNLPKINPVFNNRSHHIQRMFTVNLPSINVLKQRVIQQINDPDISPPSTFQVLAAHYWISVARANGLQSEDGTLTFLSTPMNCRALLNPPVDSAYIGNCLRSIVVESNSSCLLAEDGLSKTCLKIREAISLAKEQPLGCLEVNNMLHNFSSFNGLKVFLIGSPRLPVYETDFGWGKPMLYAFIPNNGDGIGYATKGREDDKVQLTVALMKGMEEFVHAFEGGFDC